MALAYVVIFLPWNGKEFVLLAQVRHCRSKRARLELAQLKMASVVVSHQLSNLEAVIYVLVFGQ